MVRLTELPCCVPAIDAGMVLLQDQFRTSGYLAIRQLVCEVRRDQVVVRGTLPCFYQKQLAQSLALKAVGSEQLCSDIEVRPA